MKNLTELFVNFQKSLNDLVDFRVNEGNVPPVTGNTPGNSAVNDFRSPMDVCPSEKIETKNCETPPQETNENQECVFEHSVPVYLEDGSELFVDVNQTEPNTDSFELVLSSEQFSFNVGTLTISDMLVLHNLFAAVVNKGTGA